VYSCIADDTIVAIAHHAAANPAKAEGPMVDYGARNIDAIK
jgi:hypothetical protein